VRGVDHAGTSTALHCVYRKTRETVLWKIAFNKRKEEKRQEDKSRNKKGKRRGSRNRVRKIKRSKRTKKERRIGGRIK
jgi:hypothetical protein